MFAGIQVGNVMGYSGTDCDVNIPAILVGLNGNIMDTSSLASWVLLIILGF